MTFDFGSPTTQSFPPSGSPYRTTLIALSLSVAAALGFGYPRADAACKFGLRHQQDNRQQASEDRTRPYTDEPAEELIKRVPELKTLQVASDQEQLPMILEKTGENAYELFDQLGSLVADEKITEENLDPLTKMPLKVMADRFDPVTGKLLSQSGQYQIQQDEYNYFIVRQDNLLQTAIQEYRRNAYGWPGGPSEALFLSSGFASSVLHFSKLLQSESVFRYLGEDHVGSQRTYVVAFAQIPEVATITFKMKKTEGPEVQWFVQGIAWVDASSFQILQIRTDLLAPKSLPTECVPKDQLETLVKFKETRLNGLANSMWLPTEVHVHEVLERYLERVPMQSGFDCEAASVQEFRNIHHFTDYRSVSNGNSVTALGAEPGPIGPNLDEIVRNEDTQAHPLLDEPLEQLTKRVPELKGIQKAAGSQILSTILGKTGDNVNTFFDAFVDVIAQEEIRQERWSKSQVVHDSYLILRHGNGSQASIEEFRMDEKSNRMERVGLDKGFFVTSGFALSCVYFSRPFQWDSRFLYLGHQKIDGRDAYAVAFAQLPGASLPVTLRGPQGTLVHMLLQGVAWIDAASFQILQIRSDLLTPHPEIGLEELTTKVRFSQVRLPDGGVPLWLPRDANVKVKLTKFSDWTNQASFQNLHRYKNYRRYRVSARIVAPQ